MINLSCCPYNAHKNHLTYCSWRISLSFPFPFHVMRERILCLNWSYTIIPTTPHPIYGTWKKLLNVEKSILLLFFIYNLSSIFSLFIFFPHAFSSSISLACLEGRGNAAKSYWADRKTGNMFLLCWILGLELSFPLSDPNKETSHSQL